MHVLLVPFGSHGDVHPFVGLGLALRRRGHRVTFVVNPHFWPLVQGLGFETRAMGDAAQYEEAMRDPDLWDPRKGFSVVAKGVLDGARIVFEAIRDAYVPGETVAVGGSLAFGVRMAHEALGVPSATVHLQPGILHSNHETPAYPRFETPRWWPRWFRRWFFDRIYANLVDPHVGPGLNAYRAELGLPPGRDPMRAGLHSPDLVLGFFPEWFGAPQPDWPPRVKLVGFPLYDERDATPLAPELERFLAEGAPPIAFTPGSANVHGRAFFEAAADACARLGRRGLLLTRFAEQVPADLPDGVVHVSYAPFSLLLPRVAALVHHGGVGTSAQGMASGVPQLVMPLGHDQFDNAARMRRLGVARSLLPEQFRGPAVAEQLRALVDVPEVAARCREVAGRFVGAPDPMALASEAIEALLARAEPAAV